MRLIMQYSLNEVLSMSDDERAQIDNLGSLFCLKFEKESDLFITKNIQNRLIKIITNMSQEVTENNYHPDLYKMMYNNFAPFYDGWFFDWKLDDGEFEIESIDFESEELICMVILNYLLFTYDYFMDMTNDHDLNWVLTKLCDIVRTDLERINNYNLLHLDEIAINTNPFRSDLR